MLMSTASEMPHQADLSFDRSLMSQQLELFAAGSGLPAARVVRARSRLDDLRRLEETIRWLQAEARGLPRAATLAAVAGLPPPDHFSASRDDEIARDLAGRTIDLEREHLALLAAPRQGARLARGALKIAVAGAIGMLALAYGTDRKVDAPSQISGPSSIVADTEEPRLAFASPVATTFERAQPARDEDATSAAIVDAPIDAPENSHGDMPPTKSAAVTDADAVDAATANAPEPTARVAALEQPPVTAPAAPAPDMVAALVNRGQAYFTAGDIMAARLLFRRAANLGDAAAALAMGATYDPAILADHHVRGMNADIDAARGWYERARELGSVESRARLDRLAHR
jgi:hypothetical protein